MNKIMSIDALTMSSQEIAEMVESRHDSVKRTIERLANQGVISLPPLVDVKIQRERREETVGAYQFSGEQGKRDSIVVVAQLSPQFTARLVDRWQKLEQMIAKPDPMTTLNDPAAMRGLLLSYTEKVLSLEETVSTLQPKAEALDRLATADGSLCIRDAAKSLQVQEKRLKQFLNEHRWVYRRPMGSSWLAYSDKLQMGLMEHKITRGEKGDGSEWVDTQPRITAKGLARLSQLLGIERAVA